MIHKLKKYEVSVKEINYGHVIVDAENSAKATQVALQKYYHGKAFMNDEPDIETEGVKEILPIGFH